MPRYFATVSITSGESQPFSSCAMMSAIITADCLCSGGYLATSASIFFRESVVSSTSLIGRSSIYLSKHDVLGAADGDRVGDHVAARHLVERREMREAGRADLQAVGLVGAVGDEVDAELALGRLDRGVGLALGHVHALGEELEVMDQLFHVQLHFAARRRRDLVVVDHHRAGLLAQPVDALPDDAVRLAKLLDAHEIAVIAVAVLADRDV